MANLIAAATGNFTAAGSWGTVDTAGEIDSQAGTVVISTSNIDSPIFTPGAITVDGVALKLAARAASPTGTFTVTLRNSTGAVDVTSVTVNVSDLNAAGLGWIFIKFSASQLLLAVTDYIIRCVCSNTGSQVTLYRSTTGTNNFSKKMRTTTTQAPAAGNHLIVCGELTGAGTGADITVTMENTATTSFGPTVSGGPPQGIVVSSRAILTWGTAASTAYYLKWKGIFQVSGGGVVNVGTSGTPIPASSTATLDCDVVSNVDTGIECLSGGTWNAYGVPPTATRTRLTADVAAAGTVLTVESTTGWAVSDALVLANTTVNNSGHEKVTILTVDSATQVTLSVGCAFAHLGTNSERLCEVGNVTRNVKMFGVSSALAGYFTANGATAVAVLHGVEMYNWGASTSLKRGVNAATTGCTLTMTSSVMRDCATNSAGLVNASGTVTLSIDKNVWYIIGSFFLLSVVGFGSLTTNLGIGFSAASTLTCNGTETFKDNWLNSIVSFSTTILTIGPASNTVNCTFDRTNYSGNVLHHVGTNSIVTFADAKKYAGTLLNWKLWSAPISQAGLYFASALGAFEDFTIEGLNIFGAGSTNVSFGEACYGSIKFLDCVFSNSSVGQYTSSSRGIGFNGRVGITLVLESCTFSAVSGVHTAFVTADIEFQATNADVLGILRNCSLAATTPIAGLSGGSFATPRSYMRAQKWGQTTGDHRSFFTQGHATRDTNIFNTASPSVRLVPVSASLKLGSSVRNVQCDSGVAPVVSVYVRKSAVGDASYQSITPANYNGNQPRLMVKRAIALGLTVDTVVDTMTAAVGTWEQLSGTLPTPTDDGAFEVYVDCDGTAGWINIDDWTVA